MNNMQSKHKCLCRSECKQTGKGWEESAKLVWRSRMALGQGCSKALLEFPWSKPGLAAGLYCILRQPKGLERSALDSELLVLVLCCHGRENQGGGKRKRVPRAEARQRRQVGKKGPRRLSVLDGSSVFSFRSSYHHPTASGFQRHAVSNSGDSIQFPLTSQHGETYLH